MKEIKSSPTKENEIQNYPCYEDDEIDLYELWLILKKRFKWIVGSILTFLVIAIIYLLITPPVYKTEAVIYPTNVRVKIPAITTSVVDALLLSNDMPNLVAVLQSNYVKEKVIKNLNLLPILFPDKWDNKTKTWKDPNNAPTILDGLKKLNDLISVKQDKNTKVVKLSVEFPKNPKLAFLIAQNLLIESEKFLKKQTVDLLNKYKTYIVTQIRKIKESINKLQQSKNNTVELKILLSNLEELNHQYQALHFYSVKLEKPFEVISPPYIPDKKKPYKPKKGLILITAIVSGLFIGIFLAFFIEWLENLKEQREKS